MAVTNMAPGGPQHDETQAPPKVALLNNPQVRGWLFQGVLGVVVAYLLYTG